MTRLPTLFVSHGAPTFALEGGAAAAALAQAVHAWGLPSAVLVVSAHWITRGVRVGNHPQPPTVHDFGGFPAPLYALQYPATGAPGLARVAVGLLQSAGFDAALDAERGLDHGAWVPLLHLWPRATVPVFQVSMPHTLDVAGALRMGQALKSLRDQGVLIVGSGSLTHNLGHLQALHSPTLPYVGAFVAHCRALAHANDRPGFSALPEHPAFAAAHPSADHILPLWVVLGASDGAHCQWIEGGVRHGALSMDSIGFG